jgi:hypothetical protein
MNRRKAVLHNNFSAEFDYLDDEIELFNTARKIKASHVYGDEAVARHEIRPKGECRKVRFRSRKDALEAIRTIQFHHNRYGDELGEGQKMPRRAYRCHECRNGYHLTSKVWAPFRQPANVIQLFALSQQIELSELADVA